METTTKHGRSSAPSATPNAPGNSWNRHPVSDVGSMLHAVLGPRLQHRAVVPGGRISVRRLGLVADRVRETRLGYLSRHATCASRRTGNVCSAMTLGSYRELPVPPTAHKMRTSAPSRSLVGDHWPEVSAVSSADSVIEASAQVTSGPSAWSAGQG